MAQLEKNCNEAFTPVLATPFLGGLLLTGIVLSSGSATTVNHGLGHTLQGWWLTDNIADAVVWRSPSAMPDKFLILNASANTTVSLWVY